MQRDSKDLVKSKLRIFRNTRQLKILADENLEQNGQIASLCFKKNEVTGEYFKTPKRF